MFSLATKNTLVTIDMQPDDSDDNLAGLPSRVAQVLALTSQKQSDMARRLGVSPGFLSDVVRGVKRPGIDFLCALRTTHGVSIDWLLTGQGSMYGGSGIRPELLLAIRLQVAIARAAVLEGNPVARALLSLIQAGHLDASNDSEAYRGLLEAIAPADSDLDLAVQLYNSQQWTVDPLSMRQNLVAAAVAHFESTRQVDKLALLTGVASTSSPVQVITGKRARVAGRDFVEHPKART